MSDKGKAEGVNASEDVLDVKDRIRWHGHHDFQPYLPGCVVIDGEKMVSMITYKNATYKDWVPIFEARRIVEECFDFKPSRSLVDSWIRKNKIKSKKVPQINRLLVETVSLLAFLDSDFATKIGRKKAS